MICQPRQRPGRRSSMEKRPAWVKALFTGSYFGLSDWVLRFANLSPLQTEPLWWVPPQRDSHPSVSYIPSFSSWLLRLVLQRYKTTSIYRQKYLTISLLFFRTSLQIEQWFCPFRALLPAIPCSQGVALGWRINAPSGRKLSSIPLPSPIPEGGGCSLPLD